MYPYSDFRGKNSRQIGADIMTTDICIPKHHTNKYPKPTKDTCL